MTEEEGKMSYQCLWMAIKSINMRTIILESKELEGYIMKLVRIKEGKEDGANRF